MGDVIDGAIWLQEGVVYEVAAAKAMQTWHFSGDG